jgi:hypothetical protein
MRKGSGALAVALVLAVTGCSGDDGGDAEDDAAPTSEAEDTTTTTVAEEEDAQVLIEDSFDDDSNGWGPEGLATDDQTAEIADGAFSFSVTADQYASVPEGQTLVPNLVWPSVIDGVAPELADTRVEVEAQSGATGAVGVACRIADPSPTSTDYSAYLFTVGGSGLAAINEVEDDGTFNNLAIAPEYDTENPPTELPIDGAVVDWEDGQTYTLGLQCIDAADGVELTGTLDGEAVISTVDSDDPIPTGTAGIVSGQSKLVTDIEGFTPFETHFESITITNLGDELDVDV